MNSAVHRAGEVTRFKAHALMQHPPPTATIALPSRPVRAPKTSQRRLHRLDSITTRFRRLPPPYPPLGHACGEPTIPKHASPPSSHYPRRAAPRRRAPALRLRSPDAGVRVRGTRRRQGDTALEPSHRRAPSTSWWWCRYSVQCGSPYPMRSCSACHATQTLAPRRPTQTPSPALGRHTHDQHQSAVTNQPPGLTAHARQARDVRPRTRQGLGGAPFQEHSRCPRTTASSTRAGARPAWRARIGHRELTAHTSARTHPDPPR